MYSPPPPPTPPRQSHGVPALGVVLLCGLCLLVGCVSGAAIASAPDPEAKNAGGSATATPAEPATSAPAARRTSAIETPIETTPTESATPRPERTAATPKPKRTTPRPRPKPRKTTKAPTDRRYSTCAAANRAGHGPYIRGIDPEYHWYQDRDGDGVVCES